MIANPNSGANVLGLTKLGPNTLVLSASNTYSGPTAVSGGTLQIGNGGSGASIGSTSGVALSNGAAVVFNHTDPVTFAPAISGSGSLTQTGSGLLTLSGTNTYSGTTTINGGTLDAGAADTNTTSTLGTGPFGAVLTNAANTIVFGGGVLQYSVANHVDYSGRFSAGRRPADQHRHQRPERDVRHAIDQRGRLAHAQRHQCARPANWFSPPRRPTPAARRSRPARSS